MIVVSKSKSELVIRLECFADDYGFTGTLDEQGGTSQTAHSRTVIGNDFVEWTVPAKSAFYQLIAKATPGPGKKPTPDDTVLFEMDVKQGNVPAPTHKNGPNPEPEEATAVQGGDIYIAKFDLDVYIV